MKEIASSQVFKQQLLTLINIEKKTNLFLLVLVGVLFVLNPLGFNTPILLLMVMVLLINLALKKKDEERIKNERNL